MRSLLPRRNLHKAFQSMYAYRGVIPGFQAHSSLHSVAEGGFQDGKRYEAGRPTYLNGHLDYVIKLATETAGSVDTVLEVGAGTGKLTRAAVTALDKASAPLGEYSGNYSCIEPSKLRNTLHSDPELANRVQLLPQESLSSNVVGFVDEHGNPKQAQLILVGQAFHWFADGNTLRELARCSTSTGVLALMWNHLDVSSPGMRWIEAVMSGFYRQAAKEQGGKEVPRALTGEWIREFGKNPEVVLQNRAAATKAMFDLPSYPIVGSPGVPTWVVGNDNPLEYGYEGQNHHGWHSDRFIYGRQELKLTREAIRSRLGSISVVATASSDAVERMYEQLDIALGVQPGSEDERAITPKQQSSAYRNRAENAVVLPDAPVRLTRNWGPWDWHGGARRIKSTRIEGWEAAEPSAQLIPRTSDDDEGNPRWRIDYISETFIATRTSRYVA